MIILLSFGSEIEADCISRKFFKKSGHELLTNIFFETKIKQKSNYANRLYSPF